MENFTNARSDIDNSFVQYAPDDEMAAAEAEFNINNPWPVEDGKGALKTAGLFFVISGAVLPLLYLLFSKNGFGGMNLLLVVAIILTIMMGLVLWFKPDILFSIKNKIPFMKKKATAAAVV